METKKCKTCNEVKPVSEFGINRKQHSNNFHAAQITQYKPHCKLCLSIKQKAWRDAHPGYWKTHNKNTVGKVTKFPKEDRKLLSAIRYRIHSSKMRAKNKKLPFDLTDDYMYNLWKKGEGKCQLTGSTLKIVKHTPLTLSIDKIIPSKGYVKGNVQWVCWAANQAKGELSLKDFINMCRAVLRRCNDYPEGEYTQASGSAQQPK